MPYAATNSQGSYDLSFKPFFTYSLLLHAGLTVAMLLGIYIQRSSVPWGGIGGGDSGTKVNLVSSAGLPMPQPTVPTESATVDPTKGLYKEEPKKPPEPKEDATKIPKFDKLKPPPPTKPSKIIENKAPIPDNAVNYGKGGQANIPSSYNNNPGPLTGGNIGFQGQGGGEFGARYPWYVESVRKRISENWLQTTIDPAVRAARTAHTVVTFTILRDGTLKNVRLDTSSGNRSMDDSAMRAMQSIEKMPSLPADWRGSTVDVTFDFDFGLNHH